MKIPHNYAEPEDLWRCLLQMLSFSEADDRISVLDVHPGVGDSKTRISGMFHEYI